MNRRSFAQSIGGAAVLSALGKAAEARGGIGLYRLEYLYFSDAIQARRFDELLASRMPLLRKSTEALGIFSVVAGPHVPATVVLSGFEGFEQMEAADRAVEKTGSGALYNRADRVLLRPTDFSPAIAPPREAPKTSRIFELRTDYAFAGRHIERLHERCAGPEAAISRRAGICPMLYADVVVGPNMPALACLIPFASLADRQRAWDAFGADPEWMRLQNESLRAGAQPRQTEIVLLSPAAFSPMQ